ncbi:hypothetical protein M885DRAFT_527814 [Pelagophyceae sp. CCMP2097]|nr:hypothetical protein M885DRAFT_527814 [Pelagophyceae sp. CCMP2097]
MALSTRLGPAGPALTLFCVVATPWAAATWHRKAREEHAFGPLRDPPRAGNRRELRAGVRNQSGSARNRPRQRIAGGYELEHKYPKHRFR